MKVVVDAKTIALGRRGIEAIEKFNSPTIIHYESTATKIVLFLDLVQTKREVSEDVLMLMKSL